MPRSGDKRGKNGISGKVEGDIRLTDYADARLPFAQSSRVSKAVGDVSKTARESRHWWECSEEDFLEDLPLSGASCQVDQDDIEDDVDNGSFNERDRQNTLVCFKSIEHRGETDSARYPFDLWFLVSNYVCPEDVGRFAMICHQTYAVIRSSAFWRELYSRFCDPKIAVSLPEPFRPLALRRQYGLRTRVIKALHSCYGQFVKRAPNCTGVSLSEASLRKLYQSVCVSTWWERETVSGKALWRFYFKFASRQRHQGQRPQSNGSLDYLDDTWANLEADCCILKVTCGQYTQIPPVLSWRLVELTVSLCSDMRSHRLRLGFTDAIKRTKTRSCMAKEIAVLESVQTVVVFDWWHPQYPLPVL